MAIFICPNCENRSEYETDNNSGSEKHICPHCGQQFVVDHDANVIIDE